MFQKNILGLIFLSVFVFASNAYAGRVDLTTYYPAPYGEYTTLQTTSNAYFATTAGNVGIGTTNPQGPLDLGNGTSGRSLVWGGNGANWYDSIGASFSSAALSLVHGLKLRTAGADQYLYSFGTIDRAGIRLGDGATGDISFFNAASSAETVDNVFDYAANTKMIIKGSGLVGIGTTNPQGKLGIAYSFDSASPRASAIYLSDPNNGNMKAYIGMNRNSAAGADKEYLSIETVEETIHWMNIVLAAEGGNVGIGTTSPAYKLDIAGTAHCTASAWSSDIRFKRNVTPLTGALAIVEGLRGVNFEWKIEDFPDQGFEKGKQIGLIAQDVEKVVPEMVITDNSPERYKSVAYEKAIPLLVEAVKEQQAQIKALEAKVETLEKK